MNLMGIGPVELIVVFVLAMLLLGPGQIASFARQFGKVMADLRHATNGLPSVLEELAVDPDENHKASRKRVLNESPAPPTESQPWQHGAASITNPDVGEEPPKGAG